MMNWPSIDQLSENCQLIRDTFSVVTVGGIVPLFVWVISIGGLRSFRVWFQAIQASQQEEARIAVKQGLGLRESEGADQEEACVNQLLRGMDQWRDVLAKRQSWERALRYCKYLCFANFIAMIFA